MTTTNLVFKNTYRDSIVLMRLSRDLAALGEVEQATALMGTPNNIALLEQSGLLADSLEGIGPNDLVLALRVSTLHAEASVRGRAQKLLAARTSGGNAGEEYRPRTLDGALKVLPDANLAVISVPGEYAAFSANEALDQGLNVFLFSDNVTLEAEVELKRRALDLGLFMLGPDCGTAIVNRVPLGFANATPSGRVGLVSASGTGLQQITCLLANWGAGVSQALGVGSRDLDDRVGGAMMLKGLRALEDDPSTDVVVLVSKPPGDATAAKVYAGALDCSKPCVVCFLGADGVRAQADKVFPEATLEAAASRAFLLTTGERPDDLWTGTRLQLDRLESLNASMAEECRSIRGLYSGGTLCYEALILLRELGDQLQSNLHLPGVYSIQEGQSDGGHVLLDLGEDQFTAGRPHPIIDLGPRCDQILQAAEDPDVGILLFDVVLGYGAHPDPASELAPAISEAQRMAADRGRILACIAVLIGTVGDPQGLEKQRADLIAAGGVVVQSNAQACTIAAGLRRGSLERIRPGN